MTTRYKVTKPGATFQRVTREPCPHCGSPLSLMNYIGGLTLVCEQGCRGKGGGFFWMKPANGDSDAD